MFVINILLVGGTNNFFLGAIVDRLLKERCSVYHVAGKNAAKAAFKNRRVVTYNIDVDDEYIQFVVRSVVPDAIIYLGAFDERHVWKDYHRCSAKYVSELTNILVTASDLGIKKFIYLSTINVYGFENEGIVDENTPIAPANVKSIIVAQGERLCKDFSDRHKINAISLRFGLVYGDTQLQSIQSDYVMRKCLSALVDRKLVINNQIFPLIYVTDASIAVYKTVYLECESGAYNVCDDDTITDAEICDIILTEYSEYDIELEGDESFVPQDYSIDGTKFKQNFSFFQKTKYLQGIQTVARFVRDNQYRLHKQAKAKPASGAERNDTMFYLKFFWTKIAPFMETLVIFCAVAAISYALRDSFYFKMLDMMLMFVVFMSVTFGKKQALVSVLLSLMYYVYVATMQDDITIVVTSVEFQMRTITLFLIGLIIGHVRDRLHERINELDAHNSYLTNEYNKLDEINDVTVEVKHELEERLLTYTDSLATNYAIIEQIDSLLPGKVYASAMNVMCNILKTRSVGVYVKNRITGEMRIHSWTSENARRLGSVIDVRHLPALNEAFMKNEVFSNKALEKDLPMLAAPVRVNESIVAIFTVWDLKFDTLTMYHINLFVTLMKIICRSIDKAYYYRDITENQFNAANPELAYLSPYLLAEREFWDMVRIAANSEKEYGVPFNVLSINLEGTSINQAFSVVRPLLTGAFHLHIHTGRMEVLLNNTDRETVERFLRSPEQVPDAFSRRIQILTLSEEDLAAGIPITVQSIPVV